MTTVISSRHHPLVKFARSLRERRVRERERVFLVEGPKTIADAVQAGYRPSHLFYVPTRLDPFEQKVVARAQAVGTRIIAVTERVLHEIAETMTPQAVVAVFPIPSIPFRLPTAEPLFALIVDRLQDPGNLGTLLRSALGAGVHAVLLTPGTVDPFNPKVVRAAAGAHFHLPIATLDPVAIQREFPGLEIVVARPQALRTYDERDWTRASAVVIGSEAHGISAELARLAADEVRIPVRGGVESLNAGVAGSIILFEAARQRRHAERTATTGE